MNVSFAESIYDLPDQCRIAIVDLDEVKFGNVKFISELSSQTNMILFGLYGKNPERIT